MLPAYIKQETHLVYLFPKLIEYIKYAINKRWEIVYDSFINVLIYALIEFLFLT